MSKSDAAIVLRWRVKLKAREAMLATARAWAKRVPALADQVAEAKRVIARHSRKATGPTIMYDDVTLSLLPANAPAVAGYVGGKWPTFHLLAAKFPHAKRLSIAVNAQEDAECLDVEVGDARPDQAPRWVKRQRARGVKRPVVYCSVSQARLVVSLLKAAGLGRDAYRLWTAHYTGREHICNSKCGFGMPTTADATQFTDRALGRSLDESRCAADFWS